MQQFFCYVLHIAKWHFIYSITNRHIILKQYKYKTKQVKLTDKQPKMY